MLVIKCWFRELANDTDTNSALRENLENETLIFIERGCNLSIANEVKKTERQRHTMEGQR